MLNKLGHFNDKNIVYFCYSFHQPFSLLKGQVNLPKLKPN